MNPFNLAHLPDQAPLRTGLGPTTTAAEVVEGVDLTGRVAVVTGGASGIGVETTRALVDAGARVVVPARDVGRAAAALDGVAADVRPMDLLDPASIDAFAEGVLADFPALHMLINSAGIMAVPLQRDRRGHELHFATNHLGHFQLTVRLWPALVAAEGARVVSVSSWGHRRSDIVWDDVDFDRRAYTPMLGYGQSKTANVLLAVEADRRGRVDGLRAFAVHPGSIVTPLARHTGREDLLRMGVIDADGEPVLDPARNMKTAEQGAATSVWCAVSPQLAGRGGVYCENCDVAPLADPALVATGEWANQVRGSRSPSLGVLPYAVDADSAARLWELSDRIVANRR